MAAMLVWAMAAAGQPAKVYETAVHANRVGMLSVKVAGERLSEPYIELDGGRQIEVAFDVLHPEPGERYAYSVVHCEADGRRSALSTIEYMEGFDGEEVEAVGPSFNTTVPYMHYRLRLPNERVQLKVSGNYAVVVYPEGRPEEALLTARFSVGEGAVEISAEATSNTDVALNRDVQQVNFSVDTKGLTVRFPQRELKVFVEQNGRPDTRVGGLLPTSIGGSRLGYEHDRRLIFEAGNEYRRFECLTYRYAGMNVERIVFHNPYYHVDLQPSGVRRMYVYDEDQDGRCFTSCSGCGDPEREADYGLVHFSLSSERLAGGALYLVGDAVQNRFDERSRMAYNEVSGCYEKALMMKQGYYNYAYVFVPEGEVRGRMAPTEGSFYETENEYTVSVYYRPASGRYDRLVGRLTIGGRKE